MRISLIVLSLLYCGVGHALSQNEIRALINFGAEWTSHEYNGEPLPKIETTKHQLVQIYAYGDYQYAQAEYTGKDLPSVLAVYDAKKKTIYVSDETQSRGFDPRSTLIHELVHYLQDINGFTESLNGHIICSESEAYDVQMLWQIINNVGLEKVDHIQTQSIYSAISCMGTQFKYKKQ